MSTTSLNPAGDPVFLHALFRTGSTWLFQAFRRLGAGYTCFQEPLHEVTLYARDDKSMLLAEQDSGKMAFLRHPNLEQPYFAELHALPDECLHRLNDADVYERYFSDRPDAAGIAFWRGLVEHSPARPVIQECRSAGRIGLIRRELGGFHAYLWRNPHDQWWSYKVAPYFDTTTQLILNALPCPPLITALRKQIGFERFAHDSLPMQFGYFADRPLSPDNAYRAFYTLWLLGLNEAVEHAHLLMNSDALAASEEERSRCVAAFENIGIVGLELGDCRTPASRWSKEEHQKLTALEAEIHQLWAEVGLPAERLEHLQELRRQHDPDRYRSVSADPSLVRDLGRYRDLLWRQEQRVADLCRSHRSEQEVTRTQAHEHLHEQLRDQQRAYQAEIAHIQQDALASEQALRDEHAQHIRGGEARQAALEEALRAIENSTSWRITAPLRHGVSLLHQGRQRIAPKLSALLRRSAHWGYGQVRHHPKLLATSLAVFKRFPALRHVIFSLLQPEVPSAADESSVILNARSRDIYRQLVAAVEVRSGSGVAAERDQRPETP